MNLLDHLAEQRIQEAIAAGQLDDLPGAGRPVEIDDGDALIPEAVRTAYRLLKNAGYVPPELEHRRQLANTADLLVAIEQAEASPEVRAEARKRLRVLLERLGTDRRGPLVIEQDYYRQLLTRLSGPDGER